MTKTQIEKADVRALRAFAATKKVKFIGKTTVDLRAELLALVAEKKEAKVEGVPTANPSELLFDVEAVLEFYSR